MADIEEPDNELDGVTGQEDGDNTVTLPSISGVQRENQHYDDTLVDENEYRPPPQIYSHQFGYNYDQHLIFTTSMPMITMRTMETVTIWSFSPYLVIHQQASPPTITVSLYLVQLEKV